MTYYLLGAGRMAHFLAERLAGKHRCLGIYNRTENEKSRALSQLLSAPVFYQLKALSEETDACLIALSDDAITRVSTRLPDQPGTVVHFSGTVSIEALQPHPQRAVCWPVFPIGPGISPEKVLPAMGEGNNEAAREVLSALANALSLQLSQTPEEARKQMHLAAVFGNNFVNHLLCICENLCWETGLPSEILQPLLAQTFARATEESPCQIQTGPARRGDLSTQAAHLGLLNNHPEWQRLYEAISYSIAAFPVSQ